MHDQTFIDELTWMFKALTPEMMNIKDLHYQMNATTHCFISALYLRSSELSNPISSWLGFRFHIDDKMADGTVILAPLSHTADRLLYLEKVYPWVDLQLPKNRFHSDLPEGPYALLNDKLESRDGATSVNSKDDLFLEILRSEWHQLDRIWDRLEITAKRKFLQKWSDHNLMDAKERCLIEERYEDAALLNSLIEERLFCL